MAAHKTLTLYAMSKIVDDKVLKGEKIRQFVILSGWSIGRQTVNFGVHCLTDDKAIVDTFMANNPGVELVEYELREKNSA